MTKEEELLLNTIKNTYTYAELKVAWELIWDLDIITAENERLFKELLKQ